jgi:tetratricopeptide (TPR) repeat protein
LIVLFLALTFLLGVFPLKDTDIYWHLRTGDWIRQTGHVPRTDLFTFTREGIPWIDLHWMFQVATSWVYAQGGVVALNLAKCVVTTLAVFLLVTARRRDWPVWAMLLAWLPALLLLGGRMYVRPETLTLLYLSIFLAVVSRWDRFPRLAWILPLVQVAWVNSHGLFVLGPIVLVFALIGALLRPGAFATDRKRWWRTIGMPSIATGAACLVNPYGITGALYPMQLAATMSNPIFSRNIAELMPIPDFIREAGFRNLPLQLHLATMILGALSFLLPMMWLLGVRLARIGAAPNLAESEKLVRGRTGSPAGNKGKGTTQSKSTRGQASPRRRAGSPDAVAVPGLGWGISLFRLLLYAAFSMLSLQATRNSHQFAAVVGTVTAWNFGEWAAAIQRRRAAKLGSGTDSASRSLAPRLLAAATIAATLLWVGSGWFYEMTGEKRTIQLGEEPLWFPHQAARFAGGPEMPKRFLSFHNGNASLFEYYHGPERKVYTDPRLEVAGADLFQRYLLLERQIKEDRPGWEADLDVMGRPVILVDHEYNSPLGATLLRSAHWRCVWFDPIAAVYVHDSASAAVRPHEVDFAARHFWPDPSSEPRGLAELTASAAAIRNYVMAIAPIRGDLGRPLAWLGLDYARRILQMDPDSTAAWKLLGQIELFREPAAPPTPRYRLPFDPVFDLSIVRATYGLRHAVERSAGDFRTLAMLKLAYENRLMYEAALPVTDQLLAMRPINQAQVYTQTEAESKRAEYRQKLGPPAPATWRNLSELDQMVTALLGAGRAESAAELLERANPREHAPWPILDRIATLRLHLGQPDRARAIWLKADAVSRPGVPLARVGTTYLVEGNFEAARRAFQNALASTPDLFEACYSWAILEQDVGNAPAAYDLALKAINMAPDDPSRAAARAIAASVARFARRPESMAGRRQPDLAAPGPQPRRDRST